MRKIPVSREEQIAWAKAHCYDTIVQCSKCNRIQFLEFKNGLANGWSTCHGLTMTIIWQEADIDKAVQYCFSKVLGENKQ